MLLPRRRFLTGLTNLLAAPAIVRFESLMPVKVPPMMLYREYYPLSGERNILDTSLNPLEAEMALRRSYLTAMRNINAWRQLNSAALPAQHG